MYRDNSLIPTEAIRLAALGLLAESPRRYGDLATAIRQFVGHIVGPSLDLLGPSLELLKVEELVEPVDGSGMTDNATFRLTAAGRAALSRLLTANVRPQVNDFNKLVIALKLRFFELMDAEAKHAQLELLEDVFTAEMARLTALSADQPAAGGIFESWIETELALVGARLDWVKDRLAEL